MADGRAEEGDVVRVDLLVNPFCMADRDVDSVGKVCREHDARLNIYNLWEIDDEDVDSLPEYMASLIREWRSGARPGSVYSNVFVNGERIPLNRWREHMEMVRDKIASALEAEAR